MTMFDRLIDRVLPLLGLEFDVEFQLQGDHFNQITESLYLGARPGQAHVEMLKEAGITHVVSCLDAKEQPKMAFLEQDFETLFLTLHDGINQDIASTFPSFFDFVSGARQCHPGAKVLVHCEAGVSRSATLVIALLMAREHKRFFKTYLKVM